MNWLFIVMFVLAFPFAWLGVRASEWLEVCIGHNRAMLVVAGAMVVYGVLLGLAA